MNTFAECNQLITFYLFNVKLIMLKKEGEDVDCQLIRSVFFTDEFKGFYENIDERTQKKIDYVIDILQTQKNISTKFCQKLTNSTFYEMRVSIGTNEYRTIIFSVDDEDIRNATEIILLNSFLKKSTKDYKQELNKAKAIFKKIECPE